MTFLRFQQMPEFANAMSNLFDRLPSCETEAREGFAAVNIRENELDYVIDVLAPGFKKEDFKVEVNNHVLTLSANLEEREDNAKEIYTRKEFGFSSFKRSFTLPKNKVDDDNIEARYENGILTLKVIKLEEAKPKPAKSIVIA